MNWMAFFFAILVCIWIFLVTKYTGPVMDWLEHKGWLSGLKGYILGGIILLLVATLVGLGA